MQEDQLKLLQAYLNTGLTPEEINFIKSECDLYCVDYKSLEDQGLLIKLPKVINDNSVYYIDPDRELHYGYIDQYVISEMGYSFLYINSDNEWNKEFTEHDIGKTVFLTREVAETALKGGTHNE